MNNEWRNATTPEQVTAAYLKMGRTLSNLVIAHGIGAADGVYAFNGEALELLRFCRKEGLTTVLEQTIAPKELELELLREEADLHPEWVEASQINRLISQFITRQHEEWQQADLIVCGSEFVRDGIRAVGQTRAAISVVPYGVDDSFALSQKPPHTGPLRVLVMGAISTRKGIPYVYEAARLLQGKAEFRVVGSIQIPEKAVKKLASCVQLMDRIPRSQTRAQYAWADVFLLPSLCEGSALVCYEAMMAGLPVLATPNTGTVVRDGVDGFITAIRDVPAIVEKLELCASDPDLLRVLSRNARSRATEFGFERYACSLIDVLNVKHRRRDL